jgi:hypothetical protein
VTDEESCVRVVTTVFWALAVAGCSMVPGSSPVAWGDRVPEAAPVAIANQPVVVRRPGSITLLLISPSGATIGITYGYEISHCGINGAIDVDGSFWDAIGVESDSVDFDRQPGTFRVVSHDVAVFTRSDGHVLDLVRNPGAKASRMCM